MILGKSVAVVSCYLADSSKCLETCEGTLKCLDGSLHMLKHKYKVETIVVGADAQCQLPFNSHGVDARCFSLPFGNAGRGRSRSRSRGHGGKGKGRDGGGAQKLKLWPKKRV